MCDFCGAKAGYTLINAKGNDGVYYRLKCKHCAMPIHSAIMLLCDSCVTRNVCISYDSKYTVYSEDFIRRVVRELP